MSKRKSSRPIKGKFNGFMKTWTGRITTLATFIIALSALYAALEKTKTIDWVKSVLTSKDRVHYPLIIKAARVMPYSLKNSIGSKEFPYWFHITMKNTEKRPVTLQVTFNDFDGPGRLRIKSKDYPDVGPDSVLSETVDPFDLMIDDIEEGINDRIRVTVRVLDSDGKTLCKRDHEFELLPKNILAWDLKTPDQKPVSRDYLVASLSAWVLASHQCVRDCSANISELVHPGTDPDSLAVQWFSKCYSSVFRDSVRIQSMMGQFPVSNGGKRQIIRTPSQVLRHRVANPLEATLLLGALTNKQRSLHKISQLVLLALADEGGDIKKSFFLCWLTGNQWHGLNMNLAGRKEYADNITDASQRVRLFFKNSPDILDKLKLRGVYVDDSVVALDFDKVKRTFRIRALP